MTRDEAETRAHELTAADPEHGFFARERDGEWQVVRIPAPAARTGKLGTATQAAPRPGAEDPRTSLDRLIPPYGPGVG
jgi:hypothetical protein